MSGLVQVLPVNDLFEHEREVWCPCRPTEVDGVLVHNSFDGREWDEALEASSNKKKTRSAGGNDAKL